jgi:hypothetical protein
MNGFEAYKTYIGVKNHFTNDKYDYFKYGNPKISLATFLQRSDKIHFDKIAKKFPLEDDLIVLIASNLLSDSSVWVKTLLEETAIKKYRQRKKILESLTYSFALDCDILVKYLHDNKLAFDDLFSCKNGHPRIFKLVLSLTIQPETFCILDHLVGFTPSISHHLSTDPMWNEYGKRLVKYKPFVKIGSEKAKYRSIFLDKYKQHTGDNTKHVTH